MSILTSLWISVAIAWPLASLANEAQGKWNAAIEALSSGESQKAESLLEDWIQARAAEGIASPEAHYNLALACWAQKDPGCASFQLLKSATLRTSPFAIWRTAEKVSAIERDIGMKEGISDDLPFRAFLLLNRNAIWIVSSLGFWLLLAGLQALMTKRRRFLAIPSTVLLGTGVFLFLVAGAGWTNLRYFSHYGVLAGRPTGVPLLHAPEDPDEKKLADLPNGTVVSVGEEQNGVVRISAPVAGWVSTLMVKRL